MSKKSINVTNLTDRIIKEYGNVILSADNLPDLEGDIIPTTLSLDIALSGGIPEGTITSIAGKEKTGKTTLALNIIKNAQNKLKKKCYYVDVEGRLRSNLLKCIDGLIWTEEQEKETGIPRLQIIRSSEHTFLTAENYINIITDIFQSESNCLLVLDSIAALCSEDDFATKAGESKRRAGIPTLMYSFLRKLSQIIPNKKSNLITITHLQANPTGYGGPTEVGGNAIKYFASNKVSCLSSTEIEVEGKKIGRDSLFKVSAAALGPPGTSATIYVRYGKGCDHYEDLASMLDEMGLVNRAGAWYNFNDSEGHEVKIQGKPKFVTWLKENKEEASLLENSLRELLL